MKEIIQLTQHQQNLLTQAGLPVHMDNNYSDTEIETMLTTFANLVNENSDENDVLTAVGVQYDAFIEYLQSLPVQLESLDEFIDIINRDFGLVCKLHQKTLIIEPNENGFVLYEKGRVSTRKTVKTPEEALNTYSFAGQLLKDILLDMQIVDILVSQS
ncbi:MAG: hypothetical protein ACRDAO_06940 [Culicoidibacterales bacterium]